jgi:hypothetical protein
MANRRICRRAAFPRRIKAIAIASRFFPSTVASPEHLAFHPIDIASSRTIAATIR